MPQKADARVRVPPRCGCSQLLTSSDPVRAFTTWHGLRQAIFTFGFSGGTQESEPHLPLSSQGRVRDFDQLFEALHFMIELARNSSVVDTNYLESFGASAS